MPISSTTAMVASTSAPYLIAAFDCDVDLGVRQAESYARVSMSSSGSNSHAQAT